MFTYLVYISTLFLAYYATRLGTRKNSDNNHLAVSLNRYTFSALFIIAFVSGFRYEVGTDWITYSLFFDNIESGGVIYLFENLKDFGLILVTRTIIFLNGNAQIMFFLMAFLSWYYIFKSTTYSLLPFLIYFLFVDNYFFWSMNGVNQFAALGISMYAYIYISKRNIYRYVLFIMFASMFHLTALLLLPLFFIPYKKINYSYVWLSLFIISIVFASNPVFGDVIKKYFSIMISYIPLFKQYQHFVYDNKYFEARGLAGTGLGYLYRILITIFIMYKGHEYTKKNPTMIPYFVMYYIGAILSNLLLSSIAGTRFLHYFIILRSLLLAIIIKDMLTRRQYWLVAIIVLTYFILFIASIYNSNNWCYPYQFSF
jgi:transmembrane protein EpsG